MVDAEPFPLIEEGDATEQDMTRKTANMLLASWLADSSQAYLNALYELEAPPESLFCDGCHQVSKVILRCRSCHDPMFYCSSCLVSNHRRLPTHRIERWDEPVWVDAALADIGLILHLGHRGNACSLDFSSSRLLVGDQNGFTFVNVHYCVHDDAPSKALQLLSAGLFPCSDSHPRSAFTISLLEVYNVFLTHGRTSAHKFYSVLERITKPGFPEDVKDRYRELMATHRKYLFLLNLQRSAHNFANYESDVHPGDQALDCVACPRAGINFNWDEPSDEEKVWFRTWFSYDGNFRSVRKSKKVEDGDLCLSDGLGYFPLKGPYKDWTEDGAQGQAQRAEKPNCDHHKAGNDTSVKWVGQDVTGVGAVACTSHGCLVPRGMVDFFKGERFIYADYAVASAVKHLSPRGLVILGITYDVMCHWIVNLDRRAKNLPLSLTLPPDLDLIGRIPKFHLPGHDPACFVRFSLDHTPYVGRMEGEGNERIWSHMNQHSGSTSEQGPGVRTDTINNLAYDWNYEKMIRMPKLLVPKFKEAKKMFAQQKAVHDELASSLPREKISEWEATSLEPIQGPNKKWSSPLMDPVWNEDGSFQSTIRDESTKEALTARVPRRRPGAARWLADGIELEHNMRRVRDEIKEHPTPTPRQADSQNKSRMNVRDRLGQHGKRRSQFMSTLTDQEPEHPDCLLPVNDEPENSVLGLPSSFKAETLQTAGLLSLAELEFDLRRAMCDDSLDSIRRLLGARAYALKYKQRERGQIDTTRALAGLREHSIKISQARWRYDNSRAGMIRLGGDKTVLARYKKIEDGDLKYLRSYLEDDSRGVGQGYASIPWIWRNYNSHNIDEWQVNALRTEWFRSRERYKRWEEQLVLLKREMVMTIRTFRMREGVWEWKGSVCCPTPGMRVYALKQSHFYGELARRALKEFRGDIQDDVVSLRWAEVWLQNNDNGSEFCDSVLS